MKESTHKKSKTNKAARPSAGFQKTSGLEKAAATIFAATLVGLLGWNTNGFLFISTLIFILLVALWDWRSYRIPNLFTFPTMAAGLAYHVLVAGWNGFLLGMAGLVLGGALLLIPHLLGGVGAGDVKALAALGALWGAGPVFQIFVITVLMGGIVSLGILIAKQEFTGTIKRYASMLTTWVITRKVIYITPSSRVSEIKIPYGAVISLGVAVWHFRGPII